MIVDFLGKFHPVLVHLPIGFFILAAFMKILSFWKSKEAIDQLLPIMLLLSFFAGIFSSITGYFLSQSGEYDIEMLNNHQWTAIAFSFLLGLFYLVRNNQKIQNIFWVVLSVLLFFVGHLGGSLTHGSDFLSVKSEKKAILDVQKAIVYNDLIQPILEEKCYNCHSSKKQKGNLRLDAQAFMLRGGKNGKAIIPHNLAKSILSQRLILKDSDEEHMPPKGKPQLSDEELKILNWWIKEGASFDKKVSQINQTSEIKTALTSFQVGGKKDILESYIPEKEVEKGSEKSIEILKKAGILILPVAQNSNYLLVNMRGLEPLAKEIEAIKSLSNQIIWMNAANIKNVGDFASALKNLTEIRILHLNKTNFSDLSMATLKYLTHLQLLNLSNTEITEKGLENIKNLKELKKVFLYKSKVKFSSLRIGNFPNIKLDTGGYLVPTLESDTTLVKIPI